MDAEPRVVNENFPSSSGDDSDNDSTDHEDSSGDEEARDAVANRPLRFVLGDDVDWAWDSVVEAKGREAADILQSLSVTGINLSDDLFDWTCRIALGLGLQSCGAQLAVLRFWSVVLLFYHLAVLQAVVCIVLRLRNDCKKADEAMLVPISLDGPWTASPLTLFLAQTSLILDGCTTCSPMDIDQEMRRLGVCRYSDEDLICELQLRTVPFLRRCYLLVRIFGIRAYVPLVAIREMEDAHHPGSVLIPSSYALLVDTLKLPNVLPTVYATLETLPLNRLLRGTFGSRFQWSAMPPLLFRPFELIALPRLYTELLLGYGETHCKRCDSVPNEPALCLVCGQFVCCASRCCYQNPSSDTDVVGGECTQHAATCGSRRGVFLLLRACVVLLTLSANRFCVWGSLYLDSHGEEDTYLRRGKPMFLSYTRIRQLTALVAGCGYPSDTRLVRLTGVRNADSTL